MKVPFIGYFRQHFREEFHLGYYVSVGLVICTGIWLNYFLLPGQTIDNWITQQFYGSEWCILAYYAVYAIPYSLAVLAYAHFHQQWQVIQHKGFWLKVGLGLLMISLDASFYYYRLTEGWVDDPAGKMVIRKMAGTLISALCMGLPIWVWYRLYDRELGSFYGLSWRGFNWRPYVWLMLGMLPLVYGAAQTQGFLDYYPTFKPRLAAQWEAIPAELSVLIYEVLYALDFIWTELFFRGFLILGLSAILGKGTVLPMTALYAFRHFGKPLGETIGSVFGGYILGVIALRTGNIMGGVLVHIGVALLMELLAF